MGNRFEVYVASDLVELTAFLNTLPYVFNVVYLGPCRTLQAEGYECVIDRVGSYVFTFEDLQIAQETQAEVLQSYTKVRTA